MTNEDLKQISILIDKKFEENNKIIDKKFEEIKDFQKFAIEQFKFAMEEFKENRKFQKFAMEKFEKLEQGQEKIINRVEKLEQGQEKIINRVEKLEQGQVKLEQGQEKIINDLADFKADVKNEFSDFRTEVKEGTDYNHKVMSQGFENINENMKQLFAHERRITNLESQVEKISAFAPIKGESSFVENVARYKRN